jgi:hypothetical protein
MRAENKQCACARSWVRSASIATIAGLALSLPTTAMATGSRSDADSARSVRISANSIAGVAFGTREAASLRMLRGTFGPPKRTVPSGGSLTRADRECGYTGEADWAHLYAYFYRDRLVGYAVLAQRVGTRGGSTRPVATDKGLRVGNPLGRARALYGRVTRSNAQGGSWAVHSPAGRLLGYSQGSHLSSPIVSIEAGHVGCGALAPQP